MEEKKVLFVGTIIDKTKGTYEVDIHEAFYLSDSLVVAITINKYGRDQHFMEYNYTEEETR